eukprot:268121_1
MATLYYPLPSKRELFWSGISMIVSHVLILVAWIVGNSESMTAEHDPYQVSNEEEVIQLHNVLSSSAHRTKTQIAITLIWIAFPFILIALHGFKKLHDFIFKDIASTAIYLFEKAYILW